MTNHNDFLANRTAVSRALVFVLFLLAATFAVPHASAQETSDIAIEAQPLENALIELSSQTGVGIFAPGELVEGLQAPPVTGNLTMEAALRQLLDGTGLTFELNGENGYIIMGNTGSITQPWAGVEEIIVTGQKRAERLQDVPIAISAFSPEDLEAQKIEGGFDLLKGVPNVTFSKTNFSGYNFQIRGIGTQAVSATTDPGVAVSMNNTTLIVNRLFEQEYLDVERVEVLRGPQGTLFGRNATAGVINVITNKPELGVWDGMVDVETGSYNTRRLRGFFNAPIGDTLAIRGAYASTKRDGYGINEAADDPLADVSRDVDDRDLWTGRLSLGWQPNDKLRFNLIWERFEEDDHRVRTSKQLCHRDDNPELLGVSDDRPLQEVTGTPFERATLSQGCEAGSMYSEDAFGTPNGASLPYVSGSYFGATIGGNEFFVNFGGSQHPTGGLGGNPFFDPANLATNVNAEQLIEDFNLNPDGARCDAEREFVADGGLMGLMSPVDLCNPDPYGGRMQSTDLRTIHSLIQPQYKAEADIIELSWDLELTDNLLFSSQTVYASDEYAATQDYNRFTTFPIWNDSSLACDFTEVPGGFLQPSAFVPNCNPDNGGGVGTYADGFYADLSPGGVVCDPQLGCSRSLVMQDLSRAKSTQYNQELRLVSSYTGDWNFSLGANFTKFRTFNDYFVFGNALTHLLNFFPFNTHSSHCEREGAFCRYVDSTPLQDIVDGKAGGDGHNYFRSANPYSLTSTAVFGELYWNATETVKVTAGLRFTWDQKVFTPIPSQLLLADYSEIPGIPETAGPEQCTSRPGMCPLAGNAPGGRGSPADPDIEQNWREPTGRIVVDWQPLLDFTDETLVYASYSRGYKGGGANPPAVAAPARFNFEKASAAQAPATFEPEYVDAFEVGTKNTLFGNALVLNGTAFYYDYRDYQISKIVDRTAINENFDAEVAGLELEAVFAPTLDWQFNAAVGLLNTKVGDGEQSIDLMDRTQGGNQHFANPDGDFPNGFDSWTVVKPFVTVASNCIVPTELLEANLEDRNANSGSLAFNSFCPAGNFAGANTVSTFAVSYYDEDGDLVSARSGPSDRNWNGTFDSPNGGAGFFADLSGNELPNAPHWTLSLGGQYSFDLPARWRATARVDYYRQAKSYARIYNTEYDRLRAWSNTNVSLWATQPEWGITVEAYVKNLFDETPITGSFLNSDDSGLTTNVFTLDPRLIGVSIRKEF